MTTPSGFASSAEEPTRGAIPAGYASDHPSLPWAVERAYRRMGKRCEIVVNIFFPPARSGRTAFEKRQVTYCNKPAIGYSNERERWVCADHTEPEDDEA